jgi:hypothetical protein
MVIEIKRTFMDEGVFHRITTDGLEVFRAVG